MPVIRIVSVVDQTAAHLREGILDGRWKTHLPGIRPLAEELGVGVNTVRSAVGILVAEGLLGEGGDVRAHTLVVPRASHASPARHRKLRVAVLIAGPVTRQAGIMQTGLQGILTEARDAGHDCFVVGTPAGKNPHKTGYLPKLAETHPADAWILHEASLEVLRWFEAQGLPALASGGRSREVKLASASWPVEPTLRAVVRRLVALGHRSIVMISSEASRRPDASLLLRDFHEELEKAGIKPREYHTPDWDETPAGLTTLLDSLFQVTPPTALICWPAASTFGTIAWLISRRLRIPEDVSLFSLHMDPVLGWLVPGIAVAHAGFDDAVWLRRIREWLRSVAAGRPDRRRLTRGSILVEGNSLGPAGKV